MTRLLCFLLIPVVVSGNDDFRELTKEENEVLQKQCGKPVAQDSQRGFRHSNTETVDRTEAPWTVFLAQTAYDEEARRLNGHEVVCSGTLISPRHIITSAYCIANFNATCNEYGTRIYPSEQVTGFSHLGIIFNTTVTNGDFLEQFEASIAGVSTSIITSSYSGPACEGYNGYPKDDYVLLLLRKDIPFSESVYPICLNYKRLQNGQDLTLFGYEQRHGPATSASLYRSKSSLSLECPKKKGSQIICTNEDFGSSCTSQVGGGQVVYDQDGTARLAATVGGGPEYCSYMRRLEGKNGPHDYNVEVDATFICSSSGVCPTEQIADAAKELKRKGLTNDWVIIKSE